MANPPFGTCSSQTNLYRCGNANLTKGVTEWHMDSLLLMKLAWNADIDCCQELVLNDTHPKTDNDWGQGAPSQGSKHFHREFEMQHQLSIN